MWWLAVVQITSPSPIGGFWRHPLGCCMRVGTWRFHGRYRVGHAQRQPQYSCGLSGYSRCHVEKLEDGVEKSEASCPVHTSEGVRKIVTCRQICSKKRSVSSINRQGGRGRTIQHLMQHGLATQGHLRFGDKRLHALSLRSNMFLDGGFTRVSLIGVEPGVCDLIRPSYVVTLRHLSCYFAPLPRTQQCYWLARN